MFKISGKFSYWINYTFFHFWPHFLPLLFRFITFNGFSSACRTFLPFCHIFGIRKMFELYYLHVCDKFVVLSLLTIFSVLGSVEHCGPDLVRLLVKFLRFSTYTFLHAENCPLNFSVKIFRNILNLYPYTYNTSFGCTQPLQHIISAHLYIIKL